MRQTRQRMLDSAATLLRERGEAGVTIDAVLALSGAPRGSVYHHFPGGRGELVLAAGRQAGDHITAILDQAVTAGDPAAALTSFVRFWKNALTDTGYLAGCPVIAMAVSAQPSTAATDLVRDIITTWQQSLYRLLTTHGHHEQRAQRLSTLIISAVEGAIILCRTHRDTAPLDDVLLELTPLLTAPVRDEECR